jgi:MscS family membrane protein
MSLPARHRPFERAARRCHRAVSASTVLLLAAGPLGAQLPGMGGKPARDTASEPVVHPASPRASLEAFLAHAAANEWAEASTYLVVPAADRDRAEVLARRLKVVLDQRLALDPRLLSPAAEGDTTDGDRAGDRIGAIRGPTGVEDPVRLERRANGQPPRWVFSLATVRQVDGWFENLGAPWLRERLPHALMREGPFSLFLWQWIGLAVALPLVLVIAWGLGLGLRALFTRLARRTATDWDDHAIERLRGPVRLLLAALLAPPLVGPLDLNPRAWAFATATARALGLVAVFWALLRLIRLGQERLESAATAQENPQARTLVPLLGNFLRVTLFVVALLVALSQFGYPVGGLLATLGIGGIAFALAAQKTVENLFGSVSLAADRAFRVGDWVRAGGTEGTIERIGLRSTIFRTLDRTVIRVPNGRLAEDRIETFGERDRIALRATLDVTYDTPPDVLQRIRDDVEAALRAHPRIWPDVVRVHVTGFMESSIRIEVVAWFQTTVWLEFLDIRHAMLLEFVRIVERNGSSFAFPSRTVYHVGVPQPAGGAAAGGPALPPMVDD